jgi:hypothetical protein
VGKIANSVNDNSVQSTCLSAFRTRGFSPWQFGDELATICLVTLRPFGWWLFLSLQPEIVAHLADAELAMGWQLRNMLANPGVALTWWDQAVWAERLGYAQQDASLSAGVFRALRESNLRLLESVPRARWVECYGVHEVRGRQTVEEFVRLEAAHDLNHLRQIDRILGGCI